MPEVDSKGLYFSQKASGGFVVREQQGGRSTLAFGHRIVAKPVDENGVRPATAPGLDEPKPFGGKIARTIPRPVSPLDKLRARIGPAAFAKAIRDYERQRNSP